MINLFSPELFPFTVSILVMLGIGLLEGVGLLLGAAVSNLFDSFFDGVDVDIDAGSPNAFTKIVGWLNIGKVPFLVILIVILTLFGVLGFIIQFSFEAITGEFMNATLASILALLATVPSVRVTTNKIAKVMPSDETSAVSTDSFIGLTAVITIGEATVGKRTEARIVDEYDQTHYIMIEPEIEGVSFNKGETVIVSKKDGVFYKGIENKYSSLEGE